jgi:hypothetical protein
VEAHTLDLHLAQSDPAFYLPAPAAIDVVALLGDGWRHHVRRDGTLDPQDLPSPVVLHVARQNGGRWRMAATNGQRKALVSTTCPACFRRVRRDNAKQLESAHARTHAHTERKRTPIPRRHTGEQAGRHRPCGTRDMAQRACCSGSMCGCRMSGRALATSCGCDEAGVDPSPLAPLSPLKRIHPHESRKRRGGNEGATSTNFGRASG